MFARRSRRSPNIVNVAMLVIFCVLFILGAQPSLAGNHLPPPSTPSRPARDVASLPRYNTPPGGEQDALTSPPPAGAQMALASALQGSTLDGLGPAALSRIDPMLDAQGGSLPVIQQLGTGFTVDLGYNAVWGLVDPGDRVTISRTTGGSAYGAAEADGAGFFWTPLWQADGQPADVVGGDAIEVYVNDALVATLSPPDIAGGLDVLTDQLAGAIAGDTGGTEVSLTAGLEGQFPGGAPQRTATTDAGGGFTADFSAANLGPGSLVAVEVPLGDHTARTYLYPANPVFQVQSLTLVQGYAEAGQQVDVTVYEGAGPAVRWSGSATAGWPHGWYDVWPQGTQPDDVVEVNLGGGTILDTTVAALSVTGVDPAIDEIEGTAPAGSLVVVALWQGAGYGQSTANADPAGDFAVALPVDLRPRDAFRVSVSDAEGDDTQLVSGAPYVAALIDGPGGLGCVYWLVDGPGLPVTLTLETGSGTYTRNVTSNAGNGSAPYCNVIRDGEGTPLQFFPGDTVSVESATWTGSVVVADITWEVDTAAEEVSGSAPPGEIEVTARQWVFDQYPVHGSAVETTTAAPGYAVTFSGFDLRDGGIIEVGHYDPTTDFATHPNAFSSRATHYFQATAYGLVDGTPPTPGEPVTAYLYASDGTTLLASAGNDEDGDPWRFQLRFENYPIEPGNWVAVEAEGGWTASLQIPPLTVEADADTDMIWGEGPKSLLVVEHYWSEGWLGLFVPVDGYALNTAYFGSDIDDGHSVSATYQAVSGNRARVEARLGEVFRAEFWLNANGQTNMWGEAQPGSTVTVVTPLDTYVTTAEPSCNGCWNINDVGLVYPGDLVTVSASPGENPVAITIPDPLTAQADSDLDQVWGQIGGWLEDEWIQVHGNWDGGYQEIQTAADGSYLATYGDVPRGGQGYVRAERLQDDTAVVFHRPFAAPDLILNANYGHDWVEGNYDPGYTVWITVTDAAGVIKATAELPTLVIPWWGGQSGFSTNLDEPWVPGQPDIQVDDRVYGKVNRDDGYSSSLRIGTINGALDLNGDSVSGTISAPWFSETLNGSCGVWEENGPGQGFQVEPDGGSYACDFGSLGWDLQPGHDVGVQYMEPDGDSVLNAFREPAPNLRLEKWAEGSGQVAPTGPAVFTLRYRNDGDAPAATIYLTDTLPAGTAYVDDSSGTTPTLGPGWVAWEIPGPLDPGYQEQFQLVLSHTGAPGDTLHNVADGTTLYDEDPWNNHAEADAQVVAGQPDLYVGKNPVPGDPAPGQTMLWEINYGNNGPVASGPVVLRDTLPAGTSIVSWQSENGYSLWTDHSTATQLVLEAPAVPGYWGDRILLRIKLASTVAIDTELTNIVEITTANDANPDDNRFERNDVWVSSPRWDGYVNKDLGWGRLVPGGEAGYNLFVRNHGNMATTFMLQDVLPAGTTFVEAWQWAPGGDVPFPPDSVSGGVVTWNLGLVEPGQWYNINFRVAIDPDLQPGAVLNNCAEVTIGGVDGWPSDNSECVAETVRPFGPNLRVLKSYQWNWEGQLQYNVNFLNLGTTTLDKVVLTDTLPPGTSFNGNWWHWFWEGMDLAPADDELVWTIAQLQPGWSSGLAFQLDIDQDLVGDQGLAYTNVIEAPILGDIYPQDNSSQVTAYTGPDVFVQKWLKSGELRAGETVVFTVKFGNQNFWPWDTDINYGSHVVDTLPAGMTFVSATAPWDPNTTWDPEQIDGNSVTWGWGPMWNNSQWEFDVVARIDGPVAGGQVVVNTVEAYSDGPNDVEPDYDNNVFELPLTIQSGRIYLPLVARNH